MVTNIIFIVMLHKELVIDPSWFNEFLNQAFLILLVNSLEILLKRESTRITQRKYGNNDKDCNFYLDKYYMRWQFCEASPWIGWTRYIALALMCSWRILSYVCLMYFILCALDVFNLCSDNKDGVDCRMIPYECLNPKEIVYLMFIIC